MGKSKMISNLHFLLSPRGMIQNAFGGSNGNPLRLSQFPFSFRLKILHIKKNIKKFLKKTFFLAN